MVVLICVAPPALLGAVVHIRAHLAHHLVCDPRERFPAERERAQLFHVWVLFDPLLPVHSANKKFRKISFRSCVGFRYERVFCAGSVFWVLSPPCFALMVVIVLMCRGVPALRVCGVADCAVDLLLYDCVAALYAVLLCCCAVVLLCCSALFVCCLCVEYAHCGGHSIPLLRRPSHVGQKDRDKYCGRPVGEIGDAGLRAAITVGGGASALVSVCFPFWTMCMLCLRKTH